MNFWAVAAHEYFTAFPSFLRKRIRLFHAVDEPLFMCAIFQLRLYSNHRLICLFVVVWTRLWRRVGYKALCNYLVTKSARYSHLYQGDLFPLKSPLGKLIVSMLILQISLKNTSSTQSHNLEEFGKMLRCLGCNPAVSQPFKSLRGQ